MKTNAKVGDIVACQWTDITTLDDVSLPEVMKGEYLVFTTYGKLLSVSPKKVIIAPVVGHDDERDIYRNAHQIPPSVIKKIIKLQEVTE